MKQRTDLPESIVCPDQNAAVCADAEYFSLIHCEPPAMTATDNCGETGNA
jgi:hypothetical protein